MQLYQCNILVIVEGLFLSQGALTRILKIVSIDNQDDGEGD